MQSRGGKHRQTARELGLDRKAAGRDGLDAACPFRLAGRKANQPAVDPALLAGRAGIEAGIFDAREQITPELGIENARALARALGLAHAAAGGPGPVAGTAPTASTRADISRANSTNACAPRDAGSNTTPGMP